MRHNRARKQAVKARMAVTGETYAQANRTLNDDGGYSYMRNRWSRSSWPRLLPVQAMTLEMVIGTATLTDRDGDLPALFAAHAAIAMYPDGANTILTWRDHDHDEAGDQDGEPDGGRDKDAGLDERDRALVDRTRATFTTAVLDSGRTVPTTLADLAELLAGLGVYQHTRSGTGAHRWRTPEQFPDPTEVLPMPAEWLEREEQIRWLGSTNRPAVALARSLQDRDQRDGGRHRGGQVGSRSYDTTLQQLAAGADMPVEVARDGLDGLMYRAKMIVQRRGAVLQRPDIAFLAEHARIRLVVDWSTADLTGDDNLALDLHGALDDLLDDLPDDAALDDVDVDDAALESRPAVMDSKVVWDGPPWRIYRNIAADPRVGNSVAVLGLMQFSFQQVDSDTFRTCLAVMAGEGGTSIGATAAALTQLEDAGLLHWHHDRQTAELATRRGQFSTT